MLLRLPIIQLICALTVFGAAPATAQADLQGAWHNLWVVPLERPTTASGLIIPKEEADAYAAKNASRAGASIENPFFGPETVSPLKVRGQYRSSMVIDPPDGRIPYSEEGRRRLKALKPPGGDGPEVRTVNERCLGGWGRAPILTNAVGNLHEIIQTPGSVILRSDYNVEVRIIPLDGRKPAIGLFQGESVGRWEGKTLVIETTHFRADEPARTSRWHQFLLTPETRIVERFTRTADELAYTFTISDAVLYARPWTSESVFRRSDQHVLEFACHEGNYSLANILSGARAVERRTAKAP